MKILGKFACPRCRSVHVGVSEADAEEAVRTFNEHLTSLSTAERILMHGASTISIERYRRCFFCHCPSVLFVAAEPPDAPTAVNQPVVAPPLPHGIGTHSAGLHRD